MAVTREQQYENLVSADEARTTSYNAWSVETPSECAGVVSWRHDTDVPTKDQLDERMSKYDFSFTGSMEELREYQARRDANYKAAYTVAEEKIIDCATGGEGKSCAG